jgi:hypothetical protein
MWKDIKMTSPAKNMHELKSIIPLLSLDELFELEKNIEEKITHLVSQNQAAESELRYKILVGRWFERAYELYSQSTDPCVHSQSTASCVHSQSTDHCVHSQSITPISISECLTDAYYEFDIEERWIERKILPLYGELPYCCSENCGWVKIHDRLTEYDGSVYYLVIDDNEETFFCDKCIGDIDCRDAEEELVISFENDFADYLAEKK